MFNSFFCNKNLQIGKNTLDSNGNAIALTKKIENPYSVIVSNNVFKGENDKYWIFKTGKSHKNSPSNTLYFNTNVKLLNSVNTSPVAGISDF